MRRFAISYPVLEHFVDHLAAAVERGHRREMLIFSVERADPGRPVNLVAGKDIEVTTDIVHVDIHVNSRLCTVDEDRNAARMREFYHLFYRHNGTKHIRHVRDGNHLRSRRKQFLKLVKQKISVFVDRRPFDDGALSLTQEMPW